MAVLTNEDKTFINYIDQMWVKHARLPTETESKTSGFALTQWRHLVSSELYAEELYLRGVPKAAILELQNQVKDRKVLSDRQMAVASIVLDNHDNRPRIKKLTESGVTTQEWQQWLLDPTFSDYMQTRMGKLLWASTFEADAALLSKVRQGDVRAIAYMNEYTGKYVPASSGGKVPEAALDVKAFLVKVMETLQKHVKDVNILEAIANDLLVHANAQGFASRVMTELVPIDIPIPDSVAAHIILDIQPELPNASGL